MKDTGIDHSVPYMPVAMVRDMSLPTPVFPLPEGYSFALFTAAEENRWVCLQAEVTHVSSHEKGREVFRREFLQAPPEVPCQECPGYAETAKRTVLVTDSAGALVGAGTLWTGDTFGTPLPRIHWVAVHPAHSGKGIAKAMVARLLALYRELGCEGPVYLTSQTKSYRAVRVYTQMGFAPYWGEKPANWPFQSQVPLGSFQEENEAAWQLIRQKLSEAGFSLL